MKNLSWLRAGSRIVAAVGIGAGLLVASCGHYSPDEVQSQTLDWKSDAKEGRFTSAEVASLFSTETEVIAGKKFPKSKPTMKSIYNKTNAPEKFKQEHGELSAGAEMKGYLNLGQATSSALQSRLVSNFEKISTWKTIKNNEGKIVFKDAFTTDAGGRKIADWSDGIAAQTGELHYATLSLDTNTPRGAIAVPVRVTVYNRAGVIQADVVNANDVKVPFVGTLIKAGKLKIYLKSFPQGNGWYMYGSAVVKMEKMEDSLKPEVMGTYVDSFFNWLKASTIVAL
jgi:hypothetical protein